MYSRIEIDKEFSKEYAKRQKAGDSLTDVDLAIMRVIKQETLPDSYCDHELKGKLKGIRCIHVRGDLLFLYTPNSNGKDLNFHTLGTHHQILRR